MWDSLCPTPNLKTSSGGSWKKRCQRPLPVPLSEAGERASQQALGRNAPCPLAVAELEWWCGTSRYKGWDTCPPPSPIDQSGTRGQPHCPEGFQGEQNLAAKERAPRGQPRMWYENQVRIELPPQWRELMGTPLGPTDHPHNLNHAQSQTGQIETKKWAPQISPGELRFNSGEEKGGWGKGNFKPNCN